MAGFDPTTLPGVSPVSSGGSSSTFDPTTLPGVAPTTSSASDTGNFAQKVASGALNLIDNNPISNGLTSLAAMPVQLLAKAMGQSDPYANGAMGKSPLLPGGVNVTSSDQPAGKYVASELGNAAVVGSTLLPVGSIADAAGAGLAKFAPSALEGTAGLLGRVGTQAAVGAGQGAASVLQSGQTDPTALASGAQTGALLGGGLASAGELGGALVDNFASNTGVGRLEAHVKSGGAAKTLTRAFNDSSTASTNPIKTMEENSLIKDLRVVDGKVNVEHITNGQGTGSLDTMIQDHQDVGTAAVQSMEGGIKTSDFKNAVIQTVKNNPSLKASGTVGKITAEIGRRFDDYTESYGDTIPFKDVNAIRVAMNKNWNPDTWDAEKAIGNAARATLYNGSGAGTTLKSAMASEQELINTKEFVQKLNGTAVKGGRLGKYLADMTGTGIGAAVGSSAGPFGVGAGAAAGGFAADKMMNMYQKSYFSPMLSGPARALQSTMTAPAAQAARQVGKSLLISGAVK